MWSHSLRGSTGSTPIQFFFLQFRPKCNQFICDYLSQISSKSVQYSREANKCRCWHGTSGRHNSIHRAYLRGHKMLDSCWYGMSTFHTSLNSWLTQQFPSSLLHRESGTPCHFISVLLPSAENSSGLCSKPTSLSAPTHDSPPRTIEECNYLLTYFTNPALSPGCVWRSAGRDGGQLFISGRVRDVHVYALRHTAATMTTTFGRWRRFV